MTYTKLERLKSIRFFSPPATGELLIHDKLVECTLNDQRAADGRGWWSREIFRVRTRSAEWHKETYADRKV